MRIKIKLGVLLLVSIIALAGIGGSYACSFGSIQFNDYFNWNNYCCFSCGSIGVRDVGTGDPGPCYLQDGGNLYPINSPYDGTADPQYGLGHNEEGKNVASTISTNGEYSCSMCVDGQKIKFYKDVTESICNAYPWYSSSINLEFGNCGDLPSSVEQVTFKVTCGSEELIKFLKIHNWVIEIDGEFFSQGLTFEELVSNLKSVKLESKQIMSLDIDFHFEEEYQDCHGDIHIMPQMSRMAFKLVFSWKQSICENNC